jgi:hypothetical protein
MSALTKGLTDIILDCCHSSFTHTTLPPGSPGQKRKKYAASMRSLVRKRDSAKGDLLRLSSRLPPPSEAELDAAEDTLERAQIEVYNLLAPDPAEEDVAAWTRMEKGFDNDMDGFYGKYKSLLRKDRKPLPESLIVQGTVTRNEKAIQREWVRRFESKPASPENCVFQAKR